MTRGEMSLTRPLHEVRRESRPLTGLPCIARLARFASRPSPDPTPRKLAALAASPQNAKSNPNDPRRRAPAGHTQSEGPTTRP